MIAVALGLAPDGLDDYFKRPTTFLRLLHYPPSPADADDRQFGSAPAYRLRLHHRARAGSERRPCRSAGPTVNWIDATPLRGAFVVNIGDMGSRLTNGLWSSTPHRVINRSGAERYSMPYFYDPSADAMIGPLPNCCGEDRPARSRRSATATI